MKKETLATKIFQSAWNIVEEEGMPRLNVRKVAKRAQCSLGALYNSYENFDTLQIHINAKVLENLFAKLYQALETAIEQKKDLRQAFTVLGHAYIEFGNLHPFLWKGVFEHFPTHPMPDWYGEKARAGIYRICDRIAEHFGLSKKEARIKVGYFWASVHGIGAISLNRKMDMVSDLFQEQSLDTYIDYCLEGLI